MAGCLVFGGVRGIEDIKDIKRVLPLRLEEAHFRSYLYSLLLLLYCQEGLDEGNDSKIVSYPIYILTFSFNIPMIGYWKDRPPNIK